MFSTAIQESIRLFVAPDEIKRRADGESEQAPRDFDDTRSAWFLPARESKLSNGVCASWLWLVALGPADAVPAATQAVGPAHEHPVRAKSDRSLGSQLGG